MASDAVVHLIDDDDAVRQAVAFLLTTMGFAVQGLPIRRRVPRCAAFDPTRLHRH